MNTGPAYATLIRSRALKMKKQEPVADLAWDVWIHQRTVSVYETGQLHKNKLKK